MLEKLERVERRYHEISQRLSSPDVTSNPDQYRDLTRELHGLEEIVQAYRVYRQICADLGEAIGILDESDDDELVEMARAEKTENEAKKEDLEERLRRLLLPKDPLDEKNTVVEIRAGAGGDEAGLFASDLYRMYSRFGDSRGWKLELLSSNPTGIGGYKEVVFLITGNSVFSWLKYESGVHRVQRVPETESSGRIHTSTATVAVLPEAEEVDVDLNPADLRIDVYRSSGPGGQSVNTTDSAVRITHVPTGLVVQCQDEKSQHKNKAKALKVLRARLLDKAISEQHEQMASDRRTQVGTGDRSAKIRTYNFPQGRVTDHRIKLTLHRLEGVLEGDLEELIDALRLADQAELLARQESAPHTGPA